MAYEYCTLEHCLDDSLQEVEQSGSVGEKQIARMLSRYSVRFFYEYPVAVIDRGKVRVWYPDFWLPDFGVAIEYNGVVHDKDYAEGVEHKKAVYGGLGLACVYVGADDLQGSWPKAILGQIRNALVERLARFDSGDQEDRD